MKAEGEKHASLKHMRIGEGRRIREEKNHTSTQFCESAAKPI